MHAADQSLLSYSVMLGYCLHLIGQFVCFFRDGTSNLKLTVVHTQVCMGASFADTRMHIPLSYVFVFCGAVIISYCFTRFFYNVLAHLV